MILEVGQTVTTKVVEVDAEKGRVALSMKILEQDK